MEIRVGWEMALWAMLLSFVLSMIVAWTYTFTYQGLSYSRGFVQMLALGGIISALVMLAIGNDVARGLGLVGALTVIRFRSTLKDTRDLMFAFASLAAGVACGVQAYPIAIVGTALFALASIYLSWSAFGSRRQFDAVLRLHLPASNAHEEACQDILRRHCRSFVLINLRELGGGALNEHAYHVKFADPNGKAKLIADLNRVQGLNGVTLLMQDTSIEV